MAGYHFDEESFDLIHERAVLLHIPARNTCEEESTRRSTSWTTPKRR